MQWAFTATGGAQGLLLIDPTETRRGPNGFCERSSNSWWKRKNRDNSTISLLSFCVVFTNVHMESLTFGGGAHARRTVVTICFGERTMLREDRASNHCQPVHVNQANNRPQREAAAVAPSLEVRTFDFLQLSLTISILMWPVTRVHVSIFVTTFLLVQQRVPRN